MKKKTVLAIALTFLIGTLFASLETKETSASPNVRIYAEMPAQGYVPGIPAGEILKVNINIESPSEWRDTANGITGWAFFVYVDPEVLEPLTFKSNMSGYFLCDFAQTHGYSTNKYGLTKELGIFWDLAEFIQGYGALGVGAGGDGKLCELWFRSKSETAYSPIDIFHWSPGGLCPPVYWTPDGHSHFDIVEDGCYNAYKPTPPIEDTEAYTEYFNETGQDSADEPFDGPEEDPPDIIIDSLDSSSDAIDNTQLGITWDLNPLFAITTVVFMATTVYLAVRKRKAVPPSISEL